MFATSTPAFPLTYSYVGQAEAPQGKADVIDVKGPNNFAARLFIAGDTKLPIMLSWTAPGPPRPPGGPWPHLSHPAAPPAAGPRRLQHPRHLRTAAAAEAHAGATHVLCGLRDVDGLKLPFRIRRAAGAETTEETTFDRFRINARIDPRRFDTTAK